MAEILRVDGAVDVKLVATLCFGLHESFELTADAGSEVGPELEIVVEDVDSTPLLLAASLEVGFELASVATPEVTAASEVHSVLVDEAEVRDSTVLSEHAVVDACSPPVDFWIGIDAIPDFPVPEGSRGAHRRSFGD